VFGFDHASAQADRALAQPGKRQIMCDEHQSRTTLALERENEIDDRAAGGLVEIAGRFVGDEDRRVRCDGARDGDALLLAAGKLGRIVVHAMAEPDIAQFGLGPAEGVDMPGQLERQSHVLARRHGRHEMEGLEDDADMPTAEDGEPILVERAQILAGDLDEAGIGAFQPGHGHEQSRFSGAGRADEAGRLAIGQRHRNALEDMDAGGAASQTQMDILQLDRRGGLLAHHAMILTYASIAVPAGTRTRPERGGIAARRGLRPYGRGFVLLQSAATFFVALMLLFIGASDMASAQTSSSRPPAGRPLKLVAFGDSLSAGYNLPGSAAFPAVLEQALRQKGVAVEIVNAGVSGDTTQGGLERLDWSVPDGTDGVILELGANDALRGVDPTQTRQALEAMITRLKQRKIPVMLAGMYAPRNLGADYAKRFDAIYRELAEKHGLVLYPFFLEGIAGDRALNQADGLHPTAEGVTVIVRNILPTVERFIATLPARS